MQSNLVNLTEEEKIALAKSMFNQVKICNPYLSSKTHNNIIREANPTWSDESLTHRLCDESCYEKAVELEKKLEYTIEFIRYSKRFKSKIYKSTCVINLNHPLAGKDFKIHGSGFTPEESLKKAKEMAIHFLEVNLLEDEKAGKQYVS